MRRGLILLTLVLSSTQVIAQAGPEGFAGAGRWQGWITDATCGAKGASAEHSDCAKKCSQRGVKLLLYSSQDQRLYEVDRQDLAREQIGHEVTITGTLEGDVIAVSSIEGPRGAQGPAIVNIEPRGSPGKAVAQGRTIARAGSEPAYTAKRQPIARHIAAPAEPPDYQPEESNGAPQGGLQRSQAAPGSSLAAATADQYGRLRVKIEPDDASVYLDGRFVGIGSDLAGNEAGLLLAPGHHRVSVVRPGHRDEERSFDEVLGKDIELTVTLSPSGPLAAAATADQYGRLRIKIEPGDASVYLDGRFVGTGSDLAGHEAGLSLAPGHHRVSVVRPGHRVVERSFDEVLGKDIELTVTLSPSRPSG